MRADLVGLGVWLGCVAADAPEEPAVVAVVERLRNEGDGFLLVYDNATNADEIRKCLPRGGAAQIIVTSNAPNWGSIAAPVEIEIWPKEVGADYLMARTGRSGERDAALALSEILGDLPLAHEQAAARYCIRRLSQTIRGSALEANGRRKGCTGRLSRSFDGGEDVCARDRGSSEAPSRRQTVDRVHRAALARADPAVPILRDARKVRRAAHIKSRRRRSR
jgi:hypothetical protein